MIILLTKCRSNNSAARQQITKEYAVAANGPPLGHHASMTSMYGQRCSAWTSAELATKGAPTSVKSQMVSGYNYMFTFADGSTVTVYHQSWTNTLQVTKTTPAKDQNKCLKF